MLYGILYLAAERCLGIRIVPFGVSWRRQSGVSHSSCDIAPYRDQQVVILPLGLEDSVDGHWYKLELDTFSWDIQISRYIVVAQAVLPRNVNGRHDGDGGASQQKQRHAKTSGKTWGARTADKRAL